MNKIKQALAAGFTLRKPDPRGPEYGYFEVPAEALEDAAVGMTVRYRSVQGTHVWTASFLDPDSFENWAKDAT